MTRHLAWLSVTSLLFVVGMLLPFLPGRYDGLAVTLSLMSQLVGVAGILLVPLGGIWLAYELRGRGKYAGERPGALVGYWLGLTSIGAAAAVAVALSLVAFVSVGPSLGVAVIALSVWCAARLVARLGAMRGAEARNFDAAPLYLVVVPVVAVIAKLTLVAPASEFGRTRAIENSAPLIRDIERHREVHGRYPLSLLALHKDYEPEVMGIEAYQYEPNGEAYNVYFEHVPDLLGTREIVMYNHRGQHEMTSHDMDLLVATPAELARGRGYYAVRDASRPHWKRFLFD